MAFGILCEKNKGCPTLGSKIEEDRFIVALQLDVEAVDHIAIPFASRGDKRGSPVLPLD